MDGVVNLRKAAGPTSHDVVNQVRRIFGQRRVGHAGTLDPMATGVLVVCLGKATRIVEYLVGTAKEYRATITLGVTTDTQDSTGEVTGESDASSVTTEALRQAAAAFVGEIQQTPPMVSAIKHNGQPLYKLAREGKTVERSARPVTIHSIEVGELRVVSSGDGSKRAEAEMTVMCSSGTYIRTLCADIGDFLGCGAIMSSLERRRVGRFVIDEAVTVEELLEAQSAGRLSDCVASISDALSDMPAVNVDADGEWRVSHGMPVSAPEFVLDDSTVRLVSSDNAVLAVGMVTSIDGLRVVRPRKVLMDTEDQ